MVFRGIAIYLSISMTNASLRPFAKSSLRPAIALEATWTGRPMNAPAVINARNDFSPLEALVVESHAAALEKTAALLQTPARPGYWSPARWRR